MLTDRQFVALQLFANLTAKWSEALFALRIKDTESIKKIADSALFYADIFLEQSGGNIDIGNIEQEFKTIGEKLEKINELNQQLAQSNKALLDLVSGSDVEEVEEVEVEEERTALIKLGAIAWIDGQPVYVEGE